MLGMMILEGGAADGEAAALGGRMELEVSRPEPFSTTGEIFSAVLRSASRCRSSNDGLRADELEIMACDGPRRVRSPRRLSCGWATTRAGSIYC